MALGGTATVGSQASVLASIPPILDSIVTSSMEAAGNLGPTLSNLCYELFDEGTLLR